jgi:hypothetical protein
MKYELMIFNQSLATQNAGNEIVVNSPHDEPRDVLVVIADADGTEVMISADEFHRTLPKGIVARYQISNQGDDWINDYRNIHYHTGSYKRMSGRAVCGVGFTERDRRVFLYSDKPSQGVEYHVCPECALAAAEMQKAKAAKRTSKRAK